MGNVSDLHIATPLRMVQSACAYCKGFPCEWDPIASGLHEGCKQLMAQLLIFNALISIVSTILGFSMFQ